MSRSSRLGIVLLGFGILLLILYIKNNGYIEGFQSPPNNLDLQTLSLKHNEIRTKFALIQQNKLIKDKSLIPAITNDSFNAINILYSEVSDYINNPNIISLYSSANALQISNLYQIIYTIAYMTDILYTIYLSLPSMVVASNIVIDSNTADFSSINNAAVTAETGNLINNMLSSIPSPSKLTDVYNTTLLQNITTLIAHTTMDQIRITENSLMQYLKMVNLQIQIFKDKIAALNTDTITINTYNDAILFITQSKYNLDNIKTKLNTIEPSTFVINLSSITNKIDENTTYYTSMQNELINNLNILKAGSGPSPGPMPGPSPGAMPQAMPQAMPGVMTGAMPGVMTGAMPQAMPGAMPQAMPGAMPGAMPQAMPGAMPQAMLGAGTGSKYNPEGFQINNASIKGENKLINIIPSLYNNITEPFQSHLNPYSAPSPSLKQAYDFRLIKSSNKAIDITESFQSYSNPYNISPHLKQSTDFILGKGKVIDKVLKVN